jgi:hypothetical protein
MHLTEPWIFFLSVATIIVSEFALYWSMKPHQLINLVPLTITDGRKVVVGMRRH